MQEPFSVSHFVSLRLPETTAGVALISHGQTEMFVKAIDLNTASPVQLLASPEGDTNENLLSALCVNSDTNG